MQVAHTSQGPTTAMVLLILPLVVAYVGASHWDGVIIRDLNRDQGPS